MGPSYVAAQNDIPEGCVPRPKNVVLFRTMVTMTMKHPDHHPANADEEVQVVCRVLAGQIRVAKQRLRRN